MTTTFLSKRKEKNNIDLGKGFIRQLLPGLEESKDSERQKDWIKYLRIAIAVIRMAEYDYLSDKTGDDWHTAKSFLFGKNNLFSTVCKLLKIDRNMARIKIISYKKAGLVGDPIFDLISQEYTEKDGLELSPTAKDISEAILAKGRSNK